MFRNLSIAFCAFAVLIAAEVPSVPAHAQTNQVEVPADNLAAMLEALILQRGVEIVAQNIKASQRESGDIDKAIRATLGISVKDIKQYGLLGGPNSEMRKLFKALNLA